MTLLENKDLLHRLYDAVYNAGDLDLLDRILAPDFVDHDPQPTQTPDAAGLRATIAELRAAFPDLYVDIEDLLAERDEVASRLILSGTHRGVYRGIGATGRFVQVPGMELVRIRDGAIAERWGFWREHLLLQQLGVGVEEWAVD